MKSLQDRARDALAEASLLAEAAAQNLEATKTSHSKPSDVAPRMAGTSTFDQVAARLKNARGDVELAFAVAWSENAVQRAQRSRRGELTANQRHYWIVVASQGREYRDVALEHGLKETTVWKMRSEAGLDPRYGLPKETKAA